MFQRINKRKNLIDNIHEDDDESERSGAGNEAALLNNLLTNESNEANNNLIENLDELSDAESDHEANAPLEIEGLDRIPSFDFDSNTDYATTKAVRRFKGKPRKASNKTDNKPVINLIENVIDEDEKSKRSNSSKISQISADRKSRVSENSANDSQNISNNEDLDEVNNEMQPAAGWDFEAVKLPARKKANWFSKFLTRVAYYTGKSVGKIAGALSHLFTGGWKFWSRMSARSKNKAAPQQKRDHESIPGWDGAKWEGYEQRDDGLDIDFRRVPAVWSCPTAAKAEKAPDVPEDPVISIYVSQPRSGEDVIDANANSSGHSGIGI